jgi:hypothetical protein
MKYIVTILVLIGFCVSHSSEREIPEGVQEIMDNYVKDSTGEWGFLSAKSSIYDTTIKSSEIEVGVPIEKYEFIYDKFDTCHDTTPIHDLIKPFGEWIIPIQVNGKTVYVIRVALRNDAWTIISSAFPPPNNKDNFLKFLNQYSSYSGRKPIIVKHFFNTYFHFPEKGDHNLLHIRTRSHVFDSLVALDTLRNSAPIIKGFKASWENEREWREEYRRKHPEFFPEEKNTGGEK